MILTKKYRLLWDITTNEILVNPYIEYTNSSTNTNTNGYFESDNINNINDVINTNNLYYNDDMDNDNIDGDVLQ
ncbi:hypothetical protein [Trichloromonas sp.]|jgi:hypothetical protein|uniref:hypothetical protein n=1 Tax=Trichloromonas sp. TaxID=3069249 RepID=UPI002A48507F|nr:hypothetical protein [Trichloromonas sp.]